LKDFFRNKNHSIRYFVVIFGILINVLLSFCMDRLGLPLFLDTVGTIAVSAITGMYFPSIFTAVFTNLICTAYNQNALYFSVVNALVAIYTVWFVRHKAFRRPGRTLVYCVSIALLSGIISTLIQWRIFGGAQHSLISDTSQAIAISTKLPPLASFIISNTALNFLDKGFSTVVATAILRITAEKKLDGIESGVWMQRPLSNDEILSIKRWTKELKHSIRMRTTVTLLVTSVLLVLVMGQIGQSLYFKDVKKERTEEAWNAVHMAAEMIDPEQIDSYIKEGYTANGYVRTAALLDRIWENSSNIQYLYVFRIEDEGTRYIFDVEADPAPDEPPSYAPGELVEFDEGVLAHLEQFKAGKEVEPIETSDDWGWLISVYYPLKNMNGSTVCYVVADVSVEHITEFLHEFLFKAALILAGFFILVTSYALRTTDIYTSYPISSMVFCVEQFARVGEDQSKLDENVKAIRSLDIHTGDEIEKLYDAICRMTLHQAEQMRNIRRLSESTAKMQDGLIITMADMVENRDSDTGAHVQKTAAYVKIIVEGLKRKGYYAEKVTPKFMSDVVRSAPLHDVGKINIPDGVLNKPGKLNDEEYEIMKTHTTAGKHIIEKAISTVKGGTYLKEARNMAAYHHERWDGKGYPEGLHGEVIPLAARIMAVADVFDALTSPRVYKPAFPLDKALAIIDEGAGKQFDPKCVEVFMEALPEVKLILKKYHGSAE